MRARRLVLTALTVAVWAWVVWGWMTPSPVVHRVDPESAARIGRVDGGDGAIWPA